MIIDCINCDKKFSVNPDLIPSSGRTIKCGSCNYVWFFDPKKNTTQETQSIKIKKRTSIKTKPIENKRNQTIQTIKENINKFKDKKNYEITEYKPKKSFSISKFLSYILVLIISFAALIVVIDTFSSPLYQKFPNLELVVFSLFETLKDIELFIKDLF